MADELQKESTPYYAPSAEQAVRIQFVYNERKEMVDTRNKPYVQFNDRTLKEYLDDSEKRLNAYVLDKESQGKEDWQANFATRAYANKAKALLAATARDVPEMKFNAVNSEDQFDHFAAEITKNLVQHSYNQGNPREEIFFLGWSNIGHGTVLSYEGFEQQNFTKKRIKSFDMLTGDVEEEEVETTSYGEPVSYEVPLMNLLIKNFFIRDLQEQPAIIFESYYSDRDRFDMTFGKYPNAKFVKDLSDMKIGDNNTYFHDLWKEGVEAGRGILVSRYMNKYRDVYRIVANGVELFNGPMLWVGITRKDFGKKMYPIAKTIFEPFANSDFFYGNSMPNAAMGEGDVLNTLYNSSLDKQYRSMVPPLLIGMANKDMLDLEDQVVCGDTKIYVDDIDQVKQMDIKGITDSDVKMIDLISRGLDLTTLDPSQEGAAQKYVTARAAVAADENARRLKGIFFMFLEDLWLQKVRLRVPNILLSYTMPKMKMVLGEDKTQKLQEQTRMFNIEKATLSDGTKGTLGIEFVPQSNLADKNKIKSDIEAEEERNISAGKPYEKIVLAYKYLDNFSFDVEIISDTLWQASQSITMALTIEKISLIAKTFPEYFAQNKEMLFRDLIKVYGDSPDKYDLPKTMDFAEEQGLQMAQGIAGQSKSGGPAGGQGGIIGDLTMADSNNKVSEMVGQQ
jgi:hypothetical protein